MHGFVHETSADEPERLRRGDTPDPRHRMFVQAGARVVFNYQKDRQAADELVRALGPDVCYSVQADLSSAEAAGRFIAAAVDPKIGKNTGEPG